jgi:selenocysteine-specific elongation factor
MTTTTARALVVGTAGHIDHGKTSLVRTLTGVDLDDLPEEKTRGITIQLGFTALPLPDGRTASFVDVPGHEKLVRTMVAGATGIDAVVLCVSAVDGAMPQTREHVAILDLLGVRHGLIALTMADLVDEELLALAADDVRTLVAGTFLAEAPIIPFSAIDGRGKQAIVDAIAALPDTDRGEAGPFRLPVDRVFVRAGFGVVVTGTAISGALADGDQVQLLPGELTARVRGIEVHGVKVDRATPGHRTALNLASVDGEQVGRGLVVTRGSVPCASILDARYRHLAGAEVLEDGVAVRVLHGTAERGARMHLVEEGVFEPGQDAWVQLRLDEPLPCLPGDRLIVRRPSPAETLGGGVIVDPWARKQRQREREAHLAGLERLWAGDRRVWLEHAGDAGLSRAECAERGVDESLGVALGERILAPAALDDLCDAAAESLAAFHAENPLARGAPRRDLRRGRLLALPEKSFDLLLDALVARGRAELDGPLVHAAGRRVELTADQQALRSRVLAQLAEVGLEGRSNKELSELGPDAVPIAHLLEAEHQIVEVPALGWVRAAELTELEAKIRAWFSSNGELTPQAFKELTGLTRKGAIPLLEWLDKRKLTRRDGDRRIKGPAA